MFYSYNDRQTSARGYSCIVIANYITVTTGSETSIHKGHNLFVKLSQEIHNKMLPSEETMLMTARIL